MDLNSLKDTISGLSLYDVKAAVRKAQNVVMNYTEMEAKVREATNNEPWGASSTLMNDIASGTHNYQLLNEIMPMIYKRFTEKTAEEWRQIYKALQLLEFLVKNGSEQVIDDARSHLSTIKMLRQFHYIDMNGKDQGVNVRNRAKELADLLNDVEKIRQERKKARSNRNKYSGVEGGAGNYGGFSGGLSGGISSSSGGRFGGFGSESAEYGGYSGNQVYGDGGGFGGASRSGGYGDNAAGGGGYEEYDEYDEGAVAPKKKPSPPKTTSASTASSSRQKPTPPKPAPKPEPVADLLTLDDPVPAPVSKAPATSDPWGSFDAPATSAPAAAAASNDDDEFDDFVAAPTAPAAAPSYVAANPLAQFGLPQPTQTRPLATSIPTATPLAAPKPFHAPQAAGLHDMVGIASVSPAPSNNSRTSAPVLQTYNSSSAIPTGPNYFTSVPLSSATAPLSSASKSMTSTPSGAAKPAAAKSGNDAFGNIWNMASAGVKKSNSPAPGPSMAALSKQKAAASIWGDKPAGTTAQNGQKPSGGLGDLLG